MTQCNTKTGLDFHPKLPVEVEFSVEDISSDGGLLLLRQVEDRLRICEVLAACVPDDRDPARVQHTRQEQIEQRVFQICMGYEDCNDASWLRNDPIWKTALGLSPAVEQGLSSQPTLCRLENAVDEESLRQMHLTLIAEFVRGLPEDIECLVLDLDSTAVEGHGQQQQLAFNGFHDAHIFHPLVLIDGESGEVITATLRAGNVGDARNADEQLAMFLAFLKALRPDCAVCVRADAGFASPWLYRCLEELNERYGEVYYLFGIPKNSRLNAELQSFTDRVRDHDPSGQHRMQQITTFEYKARSWEHPRQIIGKAERTGDKDNPRYLVTNLSGFSGRLLYRAYCQRGNCELRIGELKNHLSARRLSCQEFVANAFRLLLNVAAFRVMSDLRARLRRAAETTPQLRSLAKARINTIRLRLLKVGVIVRQTARRIWIRGPRTFGLATVFTQLLRGPPRS